MRILGWLATVLAVLLGLLVLVVGALVLHPALLRYREAAPYVAMGLALVAFLLTWAGAHLRGAQRSYSDPWRWAVLLLALTGYGLLAWKLAVREANRQAVLDAEPRQRIALGMHFIICYPGPLEAELLIRKGLVGGFFFDSRHTKGETVYTLRALTRRLQEIARQTGMPPLILCTDHEGGLIQKMSPPLEPTPSLRKLAEEWPAEVPMTVENVRARCRELGTEHGRTLASLGINMNLAPVADLLPAAKVANDSQTHLNRRAFSADPALTQAAASGYVEGLHSQGVRASLKHFPGIASVTVDTHLRPGEIAKPLDALRSQDLVPFMRTLSELSPPPAVMLSHSRVTALDAERLSSYSPATVHVLREHSPGVVTITDCYSMQPISRGPGGAANATRQALEAGVDLILFAWDGALYFDAMAAVLREWEPSPEAAAALQASHRRVAAYRLNPPGPPTNTEPGNPQAATPPASTGTP